MRSITYISRATNVVSRATNVVNSTNVPRELTQIYRSAQKQNGKFGITGIISYTRGHYIQIIEGADEIVAQLFSKIKSDERHTNVTTLLDISISERSFPDNGMKLIKSITKDPDFRSFLHNNTEVILSLPPVKQALIRKISGLRISGELSTNSLQGKYIRLVTWPDVTAIGQSLELLGLCAKLVNKTSSYDEIISSGEFGPPQYIASILKSFEEKGLLSVTSAPTIERSTRNEAKSSFYSKMKKFLRR